MAREIALSRMKAMNDSGIICIAGPTGAGKTAAALHIAEALAAKGTVADIINADSRQVYRDFPVITAQPSASEQSAFCHKLYGWLESDKKISAGQWARLAADAIADTRARGRVPILVGGTGFYMKALLDGIAEIPITPREVAQSLLDECEAVGAPAMHARLAGIDPAYASKIHPNDRQRTIRALEVWQSTGHTFSWWHEHAMPQAGLKALRLGIGLPLEELAPLLSKRIGIMLENGAVAEARKALLRCPDRNAPAWSGIGCMELGAYLKGETDMQECIRLWMANTRAYAKRQWTWFRADPRILWHRPGDFEKLERLAFRFLETASGGEDKAPQAVRT